MNRNKQTETMQSKSSSAKDYFNRARTWADDNFSQLQQSRNRYQLAFVLAMGVNIVSVIGITTLAHYQTLVPIVLHHYANGVTTVDAPSNSLAPSNQAQVDSDIARYVQHREAYDIGSYRMQFDLIQLLSNASVAAQYRAEQDKHNSLSPIHTLGVTGYREVHIYSIHHLDGQWANQADIKKNHFNLAEVDFTLTDTDKVNGLLSPQHYSALVGWQYTTPSDSPAIRWQNWAGFQVFRYSKSVRNVPASAAHSSPKDTL